MFLRAAVFMGFTCLAIMPAQVMAQTGTAQSAIAAEAQAEAADEQSPAIKAKQEALTEKTADLAQKLDLTQMQHFTVIYANYMIYSMVKAVESDVTRAVQGCTTANKELEIDMNTRFSAWQGAIEGPRKEAWSNIESMIAAQNYLSKAGFEEIFALVDETRALNSQEFGKTPVTTPEACKYMISKMDDTEKNMIQMLQSTLVTYPNMLQKTQE